MGLCVVKWAGFCLLFFVSSRPSLHSFFFSVSSAVQRDLFPLGFLVACFGDSMVYLLFLFFLLLFSPSLSVFFLNLAALSVADLPF